MPRYNVEYNGVTTLRREFPDDIGDVKAAKIAVYNRAGSVLLASVAATVTNIGAASTYLYKGILTSDVNVGDYQVTLNATPDTIYAGDVYQVGGDTTSQDTLTVEAYNPTRRVVTFSDYFRHAHAAGEYCKARFATYSLTTTATTTWTSGLDITIVWTFYSDGAGTASPYMPTSDLGVVIKKLAGEGGLESAFRVRYRQYSELLQDVDFTTVAADAKNELSDLFESRGMDVVKVVDSHAFYELHLVQIAYSMAFGMGGEWADERAALTLRRSELITTVTANPVWQDGDGDLSEEEAETQTFERPYPRRRL